MDREVGPPEGFVVRESWSPTVCPEDKSRLHVTHTYTTHTLLPRWGGRGPCPRAEHLSGHPQRPHTSYPQVHRDQLHRKITHMWDLVVTQAREQLR